MSEFKSLAEFCKALMKAEKGEVDSRLISNKEHFDGFTEDELAQLENLAERLSEKEDGRI